MTETYKELTLEFTRQPTVFQNPNPTVPLAAVVQFATNKKVKTTVELWDGEKRLAITFDQNPEEGLPIRPIAPQPFVVLFAPDRERAGAGPRAVAERY